MQDPPNQGQVGYDASTAEQYKHLVHEIGRLEYAQSRAKDSREFAKKFLKLGFSLAGYCAGAYACYNLVGKTRLPYDFHMRGWGALLCASVSYKITAACLNGFSNSTHLFGIFHAISHRLFPGIKERNNQLCNLYAQEAGLRPSIFPDRELAKQFIEQLQKQHAGLTAAITSQDDEMQRIKHEAENDAAVKKAHDEFRNNFEQYIECVHDKFVKENVVNGNMDIIINGLIYYVSLLPTEETPYHSYRIIDQHAGTIIEHALGLYFVAHFRHSYYVKSADQFSKTLAEINDAISYKPTANTRLKGLLQDLKNYGNAYPHGSYYRY